MPFYKYRCAECGATVELFRKISEMMDDTTCNQCNLNMEHVIEAPSVRIKESLDDRMNRNWEDRKKKKATGEW